MKTILFAMAAMLSFVSAQAQVGPKRIYECATNTDPDVININVISAYGKTYAALYEQSCDGDCYAEDMIELKYVDTGADSTRTYVQVANYKAQYSGMKMKKPSRKTRGLRMVFPIFANGSVGGAVTATKDPLGEKLPKLQLVCRRIISAI